MVPETKNFGEGEWASNNSNLRTNVEVDNHPSLFSCPTRRLHSYEMKRP